MQKITLEVCCGDLQSVLAAAQGGAARIELCSALEVGGVTPSIGLVLNAVEQSQIPVNVLIRPRPGDFLYSQAELSLMVDDIHLACQSGANGVVIGVLDADGNVDIPAMRRLIEAADGAEVTFHRAFDLCRDPEQALEGVIGLGCKRVLTSGLAPSAMEGLDTLRRLSAQAAGRISIMAGGGVSPANALAIAKGAGLSEIHASARDTVASGMRWRKQGVSMGAKGADEYAIMQTSADIVRAITDSLQPQASHSLGR